MVKLVVVGVVEAFVLVVVVLVEVSLLVADNEIPVSCVTHMTRERSDRDTGAERP